MQLSESPSASRQPLGLPAGSIRAILTLLIVAVVVGQALRGAQVAILWMEALMIALAHYYTSRRFIDLPRDALRRLESEGLIEHEPHPLYLPKYSIRILIVLIFVGLAVVLDRQGRLFEPASIGLLGMVFAYFLGIVWKIFVGWFMRLRGGPIWSRWKDVKAAMVVLAMLVVGTVHLLGYGEDLPPFADATAIGLVLFYFGSR